MEITSVSKHKRNKEKMSVYIDGRYSFSISEDDYLSLNLYEKKVITGEEIEYIKENVNFRAAKYTAIKFVSFKLRTEKEVRLKLEREGFDEDVTVRVLEELRAMGYINDLIYTQKYAFDRSKLKPTSKRLLKLELENRGIQEDIIDGVLSDWEIDEVSIAEGLIKRKFGKYNLKDEKTLKKIKAFLHHRGFDYGTIESAMKGFDIEG